MAAELDRIATEQINPETAQKMVLNMLSTGAMIRMGKGYGNLMVDMQATNEKLVRRCQRVVMTATGAEEKTAITALEQCGYRCKTAIVMILCGTDPEGAAALLENAGGRIRKLSGNPSP